MFFASRQKRIEKLLAEYRDIVAQCLDLMSAAFKDYCRTGDRDGLHKNYLCLHQAESRADDIRREIEVMMYSKTLFPESRGDILRLLESLDKVPNQAEAVVLSVETQHITIPESIRPGIMQLIGICQQCVAALLEATAKLFVDFTNATVAIGKIDQLESDADHLEATLIDQVFSSDMDGTDKLLLRDMITHIAALSDRAENAGDLIRIMVAKRRI